MNLQELVYLIQLTEESQFGPQNGNNPRIFRESFVASKIANLQTIPRFYNVGLLYYEVQQFTLSGI